VPETLIEPQGEDDLTQAIKDALSAWIDDAVITPDTTASVTAAVRWPGANVWGRLVEEHVLPVSERLYRAAASVVDGTALSAFLDGVRTRLVDESTLIDDIKTSQEKYGDAAVDLDWTGADGKSSPWHTRSALLGQNEAQQTSATAAVDSSPTSALKEWRARQDNRTRSAHRQAHRQRVPVSEPFSVGGEDLMYPGDTQRGSPSNTLNCRCEFYLVTEETASMTASLTAAVTVDTDLPFAPRDTDWDGQAARTALTEWATDDAGELDEDALARAYVWRTDGPPSDWKLPVARVSDGDLQLVWNAVTAAAAAVQGARTPLDVPAEDLDSIRSAISSLYSTAAEAFDDDTITAPWDRETEASLAISKILHTLPASASARTVLASLEDTVSSIEAKEMADERRTLMASALSSAIDDAQQSTPEGDDGGPWHPPASWFTPPDGTQKELISPEGRVAGYVATWEDVDGSPMCHAGFAGEGECQRVPRGGSYDYFHQGNVTLELDDGSKVHPGLLTTDIGHGPATPHVDQQVAHYDNPQAIAAAVVVGEDDKGIWMSGAVLPQVMKDADKFTRLQLTPVSGHWSETQVGGPLELIAVTSVNKPGYPQRSSSGYKLAASMVAAMDGNGAAGELESFRAQLADMLSTVDLLLDGMSEGEEGPPFDENGQPVAASVTPDEPTEEADEPKVREYPDGVDRELVEAAIGALDDVKKMGTKDLTATALPGIQMPKCLQILSDFLEEGGESSHHSRAAAVKAAEAICRSTNVRNAAVRARACRLVSEYRVKAGKR
jgi:hypothetical protein